MNQQESPVKAARRQASEETTGEPPQHRRSRGPRTLSAPAWLVVADLVRDANRAVQEFDRLDPHLRLCASVGFRCPTGLPKT
jgi:hypothetical protein